MSKPGRPVLLGETPKKISRAQKKREQPEHYRLMRQVYRVLGTRAWRIQYCRLCGNKPLCRKIGTTSSEIVGAVSYETRTIYVDLREQVFSTIVHECLHVIVGHRFTGEDARSEEELEVLRLEQLIMRHMTDIQARRLHLLIADCLAPCRIPQKRLPFR